MHKLRLVAVIKELEPKIINKPDDLYPGVFESTSTLHFRKTTVSDGLSVESLVIKANDEKASEFIIGGIYELSLNPAETEASESDHAETSATTESTELSKEQQEAA